MLDIIDLEFHISINSYNHKYAVQKSINIFNSYKANITTANLSEEKNEDTKKSNGELLAP